MLKSSSKEPVWAVGLMTGTVLDGNIDVALLKTDGESIAEFGVYSLEPYDDVAIDLLRESLLAAQQWQFRGNEPAIFARAESELTRQQSAAVASVLAKHSISSDDICIVGFHGQSVLHRAPTATQFGQTRQLGDGQQMADTLGIPVAWDFRTADVTAGGQGAPLAPVYHRALLQMLKSEKQACGASRAVLNLGGIGNITWWGDDDQLVAFDSGPANAPINDWVSRQGYGRMDFGGQLASKGMVDEQRLAGLLQHSYFSQAYPKSLDRFDFTSAMADGLSLADGAALLTAFSASAVGRALDILPQRPQTLVLSGGGRHNPALVAEIAQRASVNIQLAEDVGWRGDAVEAECFAFLALRVLHNLPLSFPSTTGVSSACCGGVISYPAR